MQNSFLSLNSNVYNCKANCMDINKQLLSQNIDLQVKEDVFTFTFEDKTSKNIKKEEIEKYLLLCLLNYIKTYA